MSDNAILSQVICFLPEHDPLEYLPKQYQVWEEIANDLPKQLLNTQFRNLVQTMPLLTLEHLHTLAEFDRAMLLLSYIGQAYVWGAQQPANQLPAALAIPWYEIAKKLGRPPILSYASYALYNWRRFDKQKPVQLGNIALLQNFLGGIDEEWFVLIHIDIEAKAAAALQAISAGLTAARQKDLTKLTSDLYHLAIALKTMCETLDRMPEHCDPYIYYNRVRPYIHGWKDNPALPQGVLYEGVTAYQNKPQQFRGETGAQSSIIPALDAALGIQHKNDPLKVYLQEMRDYMPPLHRQYMQTIEQNSTIRDVVTANKNHAELKEYYNECVQLVGRFRQKHLEYAASYIFKQSQTSVANPTTTGTGGTPFMTYLKKHRDESLEFII